MKKGVVLCMVLCLLAVSGMCAMAQTTTDTTAVATVTTTDVTAAATSSNETTTADTTITETTAALTTDTTAALTTTNATAQVLATTAAPRTTIKNGRITTVKQSGMQTTRTTVPLHTLYNTNGVMLQAPAGVFSRGTVIAVQFTSISLPDIANRAHGYEVLALANGETMQPDGVVTLTFSIPTGYIARDTAVVRVNDNGTTQILVSRVDAAAGTVTVETDVLGTFAVAQLNTTAKKDMTWLSIAALVIVLALAVGGYIYYRKKIK